MSLFHPQPVLSLWVIITTHRDGWVETEHTVADTDRGDGASMAEQRHRGQQQRQQQLEHDQHINSRIDGRHGVMYERGGPTPLITAALFRHSPRQDVANE